MLPQLGGLAKQFSDALDNGFDLIPANECVETGRKMRFGRESSAYSQRKTGFRFPIQRARDGSQPDVIDLRVSAPDAAARNGNFELARQVVKLGITSEHLRRGQRKR